MNLTRTDIQPRHAPAPHPHRRQAAIAGLVLLLAACASTPPPPTEQMAVSSAALAHAVQAGAPELAPLEMGMAREKMAQARAAMDSKSNQRALALAQQAQFDAQLAEAKAEATKSRQAAEAVADSNRVLREELNRKTN